MPMIRAYKSGQEEKESAMREFNSCIEHIRRGRMSYTKAKRIIKFESVAREYIGEYGFPLQQLEDALKEGYEKLWQNCIGKLECRAFLEKAVVYVVRGNQLIPIDKISPSANLETKADDASKDKWQFSTEHFRKTKTEKMHQNILPRKII